MDRASSVANPWHGTPMNRSWFPRALASLPVLLTACLALSPLACTSSGGEDTADGGTEGGDGDGDGDCSVSYSWNPGAGDVTSFPTWEMAVEDANTPTGQRVQVSVDDFPGFTAYDRWDVTITRDLNDLDGFSVLGEAFLGFDGALADTLARTRARPRRRTPDSRTPRNARRSGLRSSARCRCNAARPTRAGSAAAAPLAFILAFDTADRNPGACDRCQHRHCMPRPNSLVTHL